MIKFHKFTWIYAFISAVVICAGIYSIVRYGYIYSIDFVGGTDIEYQAKRSITVKEAEAVLKNGKISYSSMKVEGSNLQIRMNPIDEKIESKIRTILESSLKTKIQTLRFETVGPVIGKETMQKTAVASVLAVVGILIYMSFAFKGLNFAIAAILAMIHDFLVVIGTYSLLSHFVGAQVDLMFVTAVLTTMSFSVHDTIVIFDKIREYYKNEGRGNVEQYADRALTETMVRSINNSMTIIFMLLSLILLGGATIRFFVMALLIGTVTGTYSSPFVATPILVWLEKRRVKN